ncbi:fimbrial protein [Enterobacter cloacae]|uniref:fimbrial protein n=1 Tax=Enterobacter cloacae TaxID=550 RepID=UPI0021CE9803|nr:fimbrial protein [Enterobacter cloacae]MCU6208169.1 fimbrial protein [Enterobacter cloacae]
MFKHILYKTISALIAIPLLTANAATLNVTGIVKAEPCTVEPILETGLAVSLGSLSASLFQNSGAADSMWHNFSLKLNNCPAATAKVTATFSGKPDITDGTLFANLESSGDAAKNMAIQVSKQSDNSDIISNNSTMSVNVNPTDNSATFLLAARMISPLGNAVSGKVSSTMLVSFTYN